ncbi:hypothetical protein Peur_010470 [Populus x canadensis]
MTLLFFFDEPNADSNGDMLLCLKPCQFRYLLGRLSFCTCLIVCLSVSVLLRGSLFFSPQISSPYKGGGKVGDNCKWLVFFFEHCFLHLLLKSCCKDGMEKHNWL